MNLHLEPARGIQARLLRLALLLALLAGWANAHAYAGPGALRARYDELRDELRHNAFGRALHVDSSERGDMLKGDVYAVLEHPFAKVSGALAQPDDWCDVLLLPFNTKYCRAAERNNGAAMLQVRIGRKYDQPVEDAYRLDFVLQPVAARADYFESRLAAATGPVGTRDYRITVSAVPLDGQRTFMHFSYSYAYGIAGRLAMQGYLATAGADKVAASSAATAPGSRSTSAGCAARSSGPRCVTTWRSTRTWRRSAPRRASRLTSASRPGSARPSATRASCARWTGTPT